MVDTDAAGLPARGRLGAAEYADNAAHPEGRGGRGQRRADRESRRRRTRNTRKRQWKPAGRGKDSCTRMALNYADRAESAPERYLAGVFGGTIRGRSYLAGVFRVFRGRSYLAGVFRVFRGRSYLAGVFRVFRGRISRR